MSIRENANAASRLLTLFMALDGCVSQDRRQWEETHDVASFFRAGEELLALGEDLEAISDLTGMLMSGAMSSHLREWQESVDEEEVRQRKVRAQVRMKNDPAYNLDLSNFPKDNMLLYELLRNFLEEMRACLDEAAAS